MGTAWQRNRAPLPSTPGKRPEIQGALRAVCSNEGRAVRSGSALPPQTRRPSWNWTQSASNRWLPEIESSSARSASASSSPPGSAGLPPAPDCTGGPLRLRRWPARSHNSTHPWRTARGCGRWTRNRRPGEGPEGQAREFPDRTFIFHTTLPFKPIDGV